VRGVDGAAGPGRSAQPMAGQVVSDLVAAGLIEQRRAPEAESVVTRSLAGHGVPPTAAPPARAPGGVRGQLVEIAGYVGGALVLASVGLFLAQQWDNLSDTAQVATLATAAVLLAAAGLVVTRVGGGYAEMRFGGDEVRRRLSAALLVGGAFAAALTVGRVTDLVVEEQFSDWPFFVGALAMALLAVVVYAFVPSALGQLVIAAAGFMAILNGWTLAGQMDDRTLLPGLSILVFAVLWLVVAEVPAWFRERTVARGIGVALALFGAQMPMFGGEYNAVAYALTAAVALAGFALYLRTAAWPYLVAGVLGITLVVPEAVIDWTDGSLGVAGGVLVAGLTLLGASLAGFRMRREVGDDS
jgi:hypothetical protein